MSDYNLKRRPVVALAGRPNVGKSTFFNLLSKKQKSIVHEHPGVTRDRIVGHISRPELDLEFDLVDTGGLFYGEDLLMEDIKSQTERALSDADVILHMVDSKSGLLPDDKRVAEQLRMLNKPIILVANKSDSDKLAQNSVEFYQIGYKKLICLSATQSIGLPELLKEIKNELSDWKAEEFEEFEFLEKAPADEEQAADFDPEDDVIKIALLGKPNAGKSSFINAILGQNRHLVSEIAGTTMDSVSSEFEYAQRKFVFIDSAGIRRKRSISQDIEKKAVNTALDALDECDVALLLIDAVENISEQDMRLANFAQEKGKGSIIVVNKWDLSKEKELEANAYAENLRYKMPFFAYSPIKFISAKTKKRVFDVLDEAIRVFENRRQKIPTSLLNKFFENVVAAHAPSVVSGTRIKFFFSAQVSIRPPTFIMRTNRPKSIHFSYERYLNNALRKGFNFKGSPIKLFFRGREDDKK